MTNKKLLKGKPKRIKMGCILHIILGVIFLLGRCNGANVTERIGQTEDDLKNVATQQYDVGVKDSRGLRMDYDQWKPLGRGDPLKNDPTYDYVPPVLERVRYWVDSPARKQDNNVQENKKSEILVLGVSSKKPSTPSTSAENRRDSYESFLKFIDGPKFHHNHNGFGRPSMGQRPLQSYHPQFFKNKFDEAHYKLDEQRVPYTVLVPPPIPPPHLEMPLFKQPQQVQTTTTEGPVYTPITTTTSSPTVTFQEANLIYHSSSTAKKPDRKNNKVNFITNSWSSTTENSSHHVQFLESESNVNKVIFRETISEKPISQHQSTRFKQKPPLVFPTETGKIVFEQHTTFKNPSSSVTNIPSRPLFTQGPVIQPIGSSSATGPSQIFHESGSHSTVSQVSVGVQMHKGQVSDDTIGNTYVNIGKPNAHIQPDFTTQRPILGPINPDLITESSLTFQNSISSVSGKPYTTATSPHHINSIYLSRPIGNVPISAINNILTINNAQPFHRRPYPMRDYTMQTMQKMHPPPPPTTEAYQVVTKKPSGFLHSILNEEVSTTLQDTNISLTSVISTTPTPTTTVGTSLTTDPLFKHYKQPAEPLKGPMYLIIQGHSKVKTYGPSNKKVIQDKKMTENNEIPKSDEYKVKHLHSLKDMLEANDEEFERISKSRSKSARTLKDLLDDGAYDVKETELGAGFEVSDGKTMVSSEKYHKGIVETDDTDIVELRKLKKFAKVREKRQLEEFLPVVEDTVETFVYDYLKKQSEGSGVGAVIASAITNDSSDDDSNNEISQNDDDEEEDDDIDVEDFNDDDLL